MNDIWWRYEWQARGSSHVHRVAWLKNAPEILNDDHIPRDILKIKTFYDPLCFATVPINFQTSSHPSSFNFEDIESDN